MQDQRAFAKLEFSRSAHLGNLKHWSKAQACRRAICGVSITASSLGLRGANVAIPVGATRIDLPAKYLARWRAWSSVPIRILPSPCNTNLRSAQPARRSFQIFPRPRYLTWRSCRGVEAFEAADIALDGEPDLSVGLEALQEKARAIAKAIKDPAEHARVDQVIHTRAFADLGRARRIIGHGTIQNGWARPGIVGEYGLDYVARTLVNNGGIRPNIKPEVLYYRGAWIALATISAARMSIH
jgi:hypothetical protein